MSPPVVVIPAYTPAACLPEMVRQLVCSAAISAVLLVDDGSGPAFEALFQASVGAGAVLLRHGINRGKGAALKTAFREIVARFADCAGIVTADADGQHSVPDILRVARALCDRPGSLILGVRGFNEAVPWRNRMGNRLACYAAGRVLGVSVTDTQTGLRGIPMDYAPLLLQSPHNRYEFELDMLLRWHAAGNPIQEVAIQTLYHDGNRLSHFRPLLDTLRVYRVFLGFVRDRERALIRARESGSPK